MNPPFEAFAYDARDAIDERDAAAVRRRVDGSARAKTWTSDDEDADDDARSSASEPSDDDDDDDDDDDASDASETSDESLSSLDGDDVGLERVQRGSEVVGRLGVGGANRGTMRVHLALHARLSLLKTREERSDVLPGVRGGV